MSYIYACNNNNKKKKKKNMKKKKKKKKKNKIIEGSLEVKLPTIWTDEKQSRAESERSGRLEERRSEEKE